MDFFVRNGVPQKLVGWVSFLMAWAFALVFLVYLSVDTWRFIFGE